MVRLNSSMKFGTMVGDRVATTVDESGPLVSVSANDESQPLMPHSDWLQPEEVMNLTVETVISHIHALHSLITAPTQGTERFL
jgi:hypothetical protein